MVSLQELRSSNTSLQSSHDTLTAVFVGATRGIGKATLQAFAKHIPHPRAIIIGRSQAKFAPELENLKAINPNGQYTFLETDISLLRNIDNVSEEISLHLEEATKIDLLFLSQGYVGFAGRESNADGLDNSVSLRYYGRLRFAEDLLPHLSPTARVVSILAGGQEGKIFEDDLDLERHYSVVNAANQFATMTTLSFDALAKQSDERAFIHVFPGLVSTGLLGRSATGFLGLVFRYLVEPVLGVFAANPADVGERMLYYATAHEFTKGSWSLDESGTPKEAEALKQYRARGFADRVVEHSQRVFEKAAH